MHSVGAAQHIHIDLRATRNCAVINSVSQDQNHATQFAERKDVLWKRSINWTALGMKTRVRHAVPMHWYHGQASPARFCLRCSLLIFTIKMMNTNAINIPLWKQQIMKLPINIIIYRIWYLICRIL